MVQLARETALVQGKQAQAQKLSPVVEDLKTLVNTSRENHPPSQPTGMMAQNDFQTLLNAAKSVPASQRIMPANNIAERNQMVQAMAGGKMSDVDIARQMGMTREEVRLILSIGSK
jgi:hypothetical protein